MSAATDIQLHRWVELNFTPVEVFGFETDGRPALIAKEEATTVVMCTRCFTGLDDSTKDDPCTGEDEEEDEDD